MYKELYITLFMLVILSLNILVELWLLSKDSFKLSNDLSI